MRLVPFITLSLGLCFGNAFAQDPFADVTNEPRPSEFIHWDAVSFAELKGELESLSNPIFLEQIKI